MMYRVREAKLEDAGAIASVHVKSWLTTYGNIIKHEDLKQVISYEWRKAQWEGILKSRTISRFIYVAETEDGEIVGFISGGKERSKKFPYDGEIYAIYILQEHQGKGLGGMLLNTFAITLKENGYQSVLVWVLTSNPSSKFYEYFGAQPVDADHITIGSGTYEETAYGWDHIDDLLNEFH